MIYVIWHISSRQAGVDPLPIWLSSILCWPSNVVNPKPHAGDISGKIGDGLLDLPHWLSWGTTGIFWLWEYYGFTIRNKQLDLPVDDWAIGKSTKGHTNMKVVLNAAWVEDSNLDVLMLNMSISFVCPRDLNRDPLPHLGVSWLNVAWLLEASYPGVPQKSFTGLGIFGSAAVFGRCPQQATYHFWAVLVIILYPDASWMIIYLPQKLPTFTPDNYQHLPKVYPNNGHVYQHLPQKWSACRYTLHGAHGSHVMFPMISDHVPKLPFSAKLSSGSTCMFFSREGKCRKWKEMKTLNKKWKEMKKMNKKWKKVKRNEQNENNEQKVKRNKKKWEKNETNAPRSSVFCCFYLVGFATVG